MQQAAAACQGRDPAPVGTELAVHARLFAGHTGRKKRGKMQHEEEQQQEEDAEQQRQQQELLSGSKAKRRRTQHRA